MGMYFTLYTDDEKIEKYHTIQLNHTGYVLHEFYGILWSKIFLGCQEV